MIQATQKPECTRRLADSVFGSRFDVWQFDTRWHRVRSCGRLPDASVEFFVQLLDALSLSTASPELQFQRIHDVVVCLLPICNSSRRRVAVRILRADSAEVFSLMQRAASAAIHDRRRADRIEQRLNAANSQLAAWSGRMSQSEAELEWLHGLSASAELSGDGDSSQQVAERILPEMCRLIRARTVAFVDGSRDFDEAKACWQTGDMRVPMNVCRSLIEATNRDADQPPQTIQFAVPAFAQRGFEGVLCCVVKSISRGPQFVGWIIAINKDLQYLTQEDDSRSLAILQQECEFGAFESGLIEAAAAALATHARNNSLLAEKELVVEGAIRSLVNAIDAKDSYTYGHSDRVAEYAREIAATMGMDSQFCDQIYMTGLLHDVGKIGVPDNVLQKPGRLTPKEFEKIKAHPVIGHEILGHLSDFRYVLPGVLHHHESVDGSGYPHGLAGNSIPVMARILAVADAYDAMTSDRPYRDGMPTEKAASIISDGAGQQWDTHCVDAFKTCLNGNRLTAHHAHVPSLPRRSPSSR